MRARTVSIAAVAVGALALSGLALASHGKAGLWQITMRMDMSGMMTPAQAQKMRAMGMKMPGNSAVTLQHCMTAAEVATDKPPPMSRKECRVENVRISGRTFSSDTVCTGKDMQGNGHAQVTFDSDKHYAGQTSFKGTVHGRPANMTMAMEGKWVSDSCGKVTH